MYLHANFHKDWAKKNPDFIHLKQAIIVFAADCTIKFNWKSQVKINPEINANMKWFGEYKV